jgi:hypothetical protein
MRNVRKSSIAALLADLATVQNQHLVWESVNLRPSLILKDGNFNSVLDDLISWGKFIFPPLESPAACRLDDEHQDPEKWHHISLLSISSDHSDSESSFPVSGKERKRNAPALHHGARQDAKSKPGNGRSFLRINEQ